MPDSIETLISESDVLTRWPALSRSRLLAARESGTISWVRGKRGSAWYRSIAIENFISKELEQPCLGLGQPVRPSRSSAYRVDEFGPNLGPKYATEGR
jgi:hypothetical protein